MLEAAILWQSATKLGEQVSKIAVPQLLYQYDDNYPIILCSVIGLVIMLSTLPFMGLSSRILQTYHQPTNQPTNQPTPGSPKPASRPPHLSFLSACEPPPHQHETHNQSQHRNNARRMSVSWQAPFPTIAPTPDVVERQDKWHRTANAVKTRLMCAHVSFGTGAGVSHMERGVLNELSRFFFARKGRTACPDSPRWPLDPLSPGGPGLPG